MKKSDILAELEESVTEPEFIEALELLREWDDLIAQTDAIIQQKWEEVEAKSDTTNHEEE